jgi:hypothetical protein
MRAQVERGRGERRLRPVARLDHLGYFVVLAGLTAGCASSPGVGETTIPRDGWATAPPPASVPEAFADAFGFDAFEPFDEQTPPPEGARLLYRLRTGVKGRLREYLIRVELRPSAGETMILDFSDPESNRLEFETERWPCDVLIHELGTDEWFETSSPMPELSMRYGVFFAASDAAKSPQLQASAGYQYLGAVSPGILLIEWQKNEVLAPILKEVIGPPPVLAGLRALMSGRWLARTEFPDPPDSSVDLGPPVGTLPLARTTMKVIAGGATLMVLEVDAVETAVPVCIGLGIVGLRGVRPSDPERWIALDLLGARHR